MLTVALKSASRGGHSGLQEGAMVWARLEGGLDSGGVLMQQLIDKMEPA